MREYVAKAFVLVALCSAAVPALADAPITGTAMEGSHSSYGHVETVADNSRNYWTASSEYYVQTPGRSAASAEAPRRVLISGYHPAEGFEAEIAAEAANRAAHTARP